MTIDSGQTLLWLGTIALVAAIVNGGLGYGFSSITVPLALLFLTSRVLNPALVLVEVAINLYVLVVNWRGAASAARRTSTILIGLAPGVMFGSVLLATVNSDLVKLIVYAALLPVILVQTAGLRRPFGSERALGFSLGAGVGLLYSVTTISGPPLALFFNNQGYGKRDFRASLAVVRLAESSITGAAYLLLGLYTRASFNLLPAIVLAVVSGVPIGTFLIRKIDAESFRRVCMCFDSLIVGFGLSRVLDELHFVPAQAAYLLLLAVVLIDLAFMYRFFSPRLASSRPLGSLLRR